MWSVSRLSGPDNAPDAVKTREDTIQSPIISSTEQLTAASPWYWHKPWRSNRLNPPVGDSASKQNLTSMEFSSFLLVIVGGSSSKSCQVSVGTLIFLPEKALVRNDSNVSTTFDAGNEFLHDFTRIRRSLASIRFIMSSGDNGSRGLRFPSDLGDGSGRSPLKNFSRTPWSLLSSMNLTSGIRRVRTCGKIA